MNRSKMFGMLLILGVVLGCGNSTTGYAQKENTRKEENKEASDLSGYYTQKGMKEGETFAISKQGKIYKVVWQLKTGVWVGVGMREGDQFAIGWHKQDGTNLGVSLYKITKGKKGPSLVGGWTSSTSTGVSRDVYDWIKKLDD